ncbi:hypothetical protein NOG11_13700 [Parvularcula sp. BGMRC 0090]|uniref:Uncharacterized protein n=1 Tax=Parvularcula maris TaxID=2965077 RepID=A0A9X2LBH5_9PROT|nr:hypothetical protein [Parvularcula maris]
MTVEFVSPSGVVCRRFADGAMNVRIAVGQLCHPEHGLLKEMDSLGDPPPFESEALQRQALEVVARMGGVDKATRQRLRQWVEYAGHLEG